MQFCQSFSGLGIISPIFYVEALIARVRGMKQCARLKTETGGGNTGLDRAKLLAENLGMWEVPGVLFVSRKQWGISGR